MIHHLRLLYWRAIAVLAVLSGRRPLLGIAIGDAIGRVIYPMLERGTAVRIARLFPQLTSREVRKTTARMGSIQAMDLMLNRYLRMKRFKEISSCFRGASELGQLRGPLIVTLFHVGAFRALGAVLDRFNGEVLILAHGVTLPHSYDHVRIEETLGDEQHRARLFIQSVEQLRRGGIVVAALDVTTSAKIAAPCMGGSIALARGPFVLSRLTGAAIVPVVLRWDERRIRVVVNEPLPTNVSEGAMAALAAQQLEQQLLQWPADVHGPMLENLTASISRPASTA